MTGPLDQPAFDDLERDDPLEWWERLLLVALLLPVALLAAGLLAAAIFLGVELL